MIDARTQVERILRPFLPRIAQVAESREGFEILLDVYAALAKNCAETVFLSIGGRSKEKAAALLEGRLRSLVETVAGLHGEIGLVDEKLNRLIFDWLRQVFYDRLLVLSDVGGGRA